MHLTTKDTGKDGQQLSALLRWRLMKLYPELENLTACKQTPPNGPFACYSNLATSSLHTKPLHGNKSILTTKDLCYLSRFAFIIIATRLSISGMRHLLFFFSLSFFPLLADNYPHSDVFYRHFSC